MRIPSARFATACTIFIALSSPAAHSQATAHDGMAMPKTPAAVSSTLTVTGLNGATKTFTPETFKALAHVDVTVNNAHSNHTEKYSGVPLLGLLALVSPAADDKSAPKVSANMQLIIASATDGFKVALTSCDADPACRSGEAIVADAMDGKPLGADGAFKLILTGDKKPGRWARNLQTLTVKSAAGL